MPRRRLGRLDRADLAALARSGQDDVALPRKARRCRCSKTTRRRRANGRAAASKSGQRSSVAPDRGDRSQPRRMRHARARIGQPRAGECARVDPAAAARRARPARASADGRRARPAAAADRATRRSRPAAPARSTMACERRCRQVAAPGSRRSRPSTLPATPWRAIAARDRGLRGERRRPMKARMPSVGAHERRRGRGRRRCRTPRWRSRSRDRSAATLAPCSARARAARAQPARPAPTMTTGARRRRDAPVGRAGRSIRAPTRAAA